MLLTLFVTSVLVTVCVMFHYEVLHNMHRLLGQGRLAHPRGIAIMLLVTLFAHVVEIWCFAFAYLFLLKVDTQSALQNISDAMLLDSVYFSFVTYTTLGFGDILPLGNIRFLVGTEALLGLVLIAWTASFFYLQMEKKW